MFGSRRLKYSEQGRPFWLLVAVAITLLVNVSATVSQAATGLPLIQSLRRDLGAIRVQLEQTDPSAPGPVRRSVAFNADLGDGGPAFRRQSLATMGRAAFRRGEHLGKGYQQRAGTARLAEDLRRQLYELQHRLDQYGQATDPAAALALRQDMGPVLDELERTLDLLAEGAEPGQPTVQPEPSGG